MRNLLLPSEQRFTCAQCGRCCHRTTVPVTNEEVDALRKAGAARWFDDDPFEPIDQIPVAAGSSRPLHRIRKHADGACVFLTAEGRCRIHEVLGERHKPLACRLFPFSFRPTDDEIIVSASFACPTVIANQGAAAASQRGELGKLQVAWARAFPEPASSIEFVRGHAISRDALARIRTFLILLLDRTPDVRQNLRRIAGLLEDWSRPKVLQLPPDAFVEYLELTGNYALTDTRGAAVSRPPRRASLV